MRKIALLAAVCAGAATLAVPSAAFASIPPPPGGGSWQVKAVSSTGGSTVYASADEYGINFAICDTAADGHHAYGEIEYQDADGVWRQDAYFNEYDGNGTCWAGEVDPEAVLPASPVPPPPGGTWYRAVAKPWRATP